MTVTPAMRTFVNARAKGHKEDVENDFYDSFWDAEDGVFEALWESRSSTPPPATPRTRTNQFRPKTKAAMDPESLTAPFRFVELNDKIGMPEENVKTALKSKTLHSDPLAGGLSGEFDISIAFDGPVLVGGSQNDQPQKLGAQYVIPGTTLRGLTRSVVEIAAFGRLTHTNLHQRFGIRNFQHDLFSDKQKDTVKAGWLRKCNENDAKMGSGYVIEPCEHEMIKIRDLAGRTSDSASWHRNWLAMSMQKRYENFGMLSSKNIFDFSKMEKFSRSGDDLFASPEGKLSGVMVFSDTSPAFSNNADDKKISDQESKLEDQHINPQKGAFKRRETVFFEPNQEPIPISRHVWETFDRNNSTLSEHKPVPAGNWKTLKPTLDAGRRIPVFWVGEGDDVLDFGLVRVFKRAHLYTVENVLQRTSSDHIVDPNNICPDFTEALFGYVHEPEINRKSQDVEDRTSEASAHLDRHLKGRVSFGYAYLDPNTPATTTDPVKTVMSAPKASYGPFYLAGGKADWSDTESRLAGRKRYPVRGADQNSAIKWLEEQKGNGNKDTMSSLQFLVPKDSEHPLKFHAKIRVHNVTLAELGGLIWALTWGGDETKRHLIGRAKNAGAGQAAIRISDLSKLRFHLTDTAVSAADALTAFSDHMSKEITNWPKVDCITQLLHSADPKFGKQLKLDYLPLKKHMPLRDARYGIRMSSAILHIDKK